MFAKCENTRISDELEIELCFAETKNRVKTRGIEKKSIKVKLCIFEVCGNLRPCYGKSGDRYLLCEGVI